MFLATSWYVDDYNIYLFVKNYKNIFVQINITFVLSHVVFQNSHVNLVRCSYFEYADGIKMWVCVFFVFVWGLKLARVDIALGGELSIQNKTLSAFISWCSRLSISSHVIKWCELTLSMNTILRETLFILFISFSS